jgi:L-threonylcarbamoyladenylate synthase
MNPQWTAEIPAALQCLQAGGILLYPTDTIWGLGCDPRDAAAVEKLFTLKGRPKEKSLILLASSVQQVQSIVTEIPPAAIDLLQSRSDRPLTIIYPQARGLAPDVASQDGSIAIRITQDPFCQALITAFGHPVTSTSANLSGQSFNGSFSDIPASIIDGAHCVIRHRQGETIHALPSRIIKILPGNQIQVIRP